MLRRSRWNRPCIKSRPRERQFVIQNPRSKSSNSLRLQDLFCPRCWVLGRAAKSKVFMAPSESPSASQSYYEDVLWFEMSQRGLLALLGCWLGLPGLYKIWPICFLVALEFALGIGIFGVFSIIGTFGIYRILTASESFSHHRTRSLRLQALFCPRCDLVYQVYQVCQVCLRA